MDRGLTCLAGTGPWGLPSGSFGLQPQASGPINLSQHRLAVELPPSYLVARTVNCNLSQSHLPHHFYTVNA